MTAGSVNQMGCSLQQPRCGSGALQQKGRVPCVRVATASAVPTERESCPCNGTLPRDKSPLHQWAAPGARQTGKSVLTQHPCEDPPAVHEF